MLTLVQEVLNAVPGLKEKGRFLFSGLTALDAQVHRFQTLDAAARKHLAEGTPYHFAFNALKALREELDGETAALAVLNWAAQMRVDLRAAGAIPALERLSALNKNTQRAWVQLEAFKARTHAQRNAAAIPKRLRGMAAGKEALRSVREAWVAEWLPKCADHHHVVQGNAEWLRMRNQLKKLWWAMKECAVTEDEMPADIPLLYVARPTDGDGAPVKGFLAGPALAALLAGRTRPDGTPFLATP